MAIIQGYLMKYFGIDSPESVQTVFHSVLMSISRTVFDEYNTHGQDNIHNVVAVEGYNVDIVLSRIIGNYLFRKLKYTPQWKGREHLADALRWAELRALIRKELEPYWADGPPKTSNRFNSLQTLPSAARTLANSATVGYLFGPRAADYHIYILVAKFLGNTPDAAKVAQNIKNLARSEEYEPVTTKGFKLLSDGFQTDDGGQVKIPPALRNIYTPKQYAIDVLFTEGVTAGGWMGGVTRNCRVDAAIAAAAADIARRLRTRPRLVELTTTPRGYYAWRARSRENSIEGIDVYDQRCIWGAADGQTLDCEEVYGAGAVVLVFLFTLPLVANKVIGRRILAANPLSHVITISRWHDLVPDPEFAMASLCSAPDSPSGCGDAACKEKDCYAMFMHADPPR
jgi:hypothetical protein